mgnify:CR=1 FL=1
MRYFPLFADLAEVLGRRWRGGRPEGAPVAQDHRAHHGDGRKPQRRVARPGAHGRGAAPPAPAEASGLVRPKPVYVATGDRQLEAELFGAARARGIPINVVDAPELSTFLTPPWSIATRSWWRSAPRARRPCSPGRSNRGFESWLPANFGALAKKAHSLRRRVAARIGEPQARRHLWERLFNGAFRRAVLTGADDEAQRIFVRELKAAATPSVGRVVLIGCGPGDPDLLTLKALQRLQEADVLVVDRLVNPRILEYARRDARRIFVGKVPGGPATSQAEINRILVAEAADGQVVARLKGGDPLIFGRAGEELAACAAAHLAVEIVPGITAAHACAARIGCR